MNQNQHEIQNYDQESEESEPQRLHFDSWPFGIFSSDESKWFLSKQSFSNQGYRHVDQSVLEVFSFPQEDLTAKQQAQIIMNTPESEQKQTFATVLKQLHQSQSIIKPSDQSETQQQKSYQASYHRGHIDFMSQLRTSIFPQSRKYCKSRRKMQRGKTYYKFVAKHMKGQQSTSCKRFDQYHLQQAFKKMGAKEQQQRQATLEALRHIKRYRNNKENIKLLKKHRQRYGKSRKWAILLERFVISLE